MSALKFAQGHLLDAVARAFGQHQTGARAGGQDIFMQIGQVDPCPQAHGG